MSISQRVECLPPYPMQELAQVKLRLEAAGKTVFDFGTGDPRIPLWSKIGDSLRDAVTDYCQYPPMAGSAEFKDAVYKYLGRRLGIAADGLEVMATRGSKEAVYHLPVGLVGRKGKQSILFPEPGYPVYRNGTLLAGGKPIGQKLTDEKNWELRPWELTSDIQKDIAAVWVNYPHNPTGATVDRHYLENLIDWCHENDCILLSDECYLDIYHHGWDIGLLDPAYLPTSPLAITSDRIVSLFSLSKRSGFTGYRSGFLAGDADFLRAFGRARANMGQGTPRCIEAAAITAWSDDEHVAERRKIFTERLALAFGVLYGAGLIDQEPKAGFYLWSRVPQRYAGDDVAFCREASEHGVILSPSSWLGEGVSGYFRLAMVPNMDETATAMEILVQNLF